MPWLVQKTVRGAPCLDVLITGGGVRMDPALCPELSACHANIAQWRHRYTPPAEEANERLGDRGRHAAALRRSQRL